MLPKLFDCTLNHWPTQRISVNVPESGQEVLELLSQDNLAAVAKRAADPAADKEAKLAAFHVAQALKVMAQTFERDQASWLYSHADKTPEDFAAEFPVLFESSQFAQRFARADVTAEFMRLYGLIKTPANAWTIKEVDGAEPEPAEEHDNWKAIRKNIKTHGTERRQAVEA